MLFMFSAAQVRQQYDLTVLSATYSRWATVLTLQPDKIKTTHSA